jgi:hypothetical protein
VAKTPSLTRKNPAGWATLHPPCTTLHYPALSPLCRVVQGTCRVRYPAPIWPIRIGKNPSLEGACRVCRVGLQGGSYAG